MVQVYGSGNILFIVLQRIGEKILFGCLGRTDQNIKHQINLGLIVWVLGKFLYLSATFCTPCSNRTVKTFRKKTYYLKTISGRLWWIWSLSQEHWTEAGICVRWDASLAQCTKTCSSRRQSTFRHVSGRKPENQERNPLRHKTQHRQFGIEPKLIWYQIKQLIK